MHSKCQIFVKSVLLHKNFAVTFDIMHIWSILLDIATGYYLASYIAKYIIIYIKAVVTGILHNSYMHS